MKNFSGPKVGFVDLMVWPWLSRIDTMKEVRGLDLPKEKYPKILEWTGRMHELPFIKATVYPVPLMGQFAARYVAGQPNYDEGLWRAVSTLVHF